MAKRTTINCLQVLNQVDGLLSEQFEMQELGDTEDRLYTKPNQTTSTLVVGHIGTIGPIMYHLIGFPVFRGSMKKCHLAMPGYADPGQSRWWTSGCGR